VSSPEHILCVFFLSYIFLILFCFLFTLQVMGGGIEQVINVAGLSGQVSLIFAVHHVYQPSLGGGVATALLRLTHFQIVSCKHKKTINYFQNKTYSSNGTIYPTKWAIKRRMCTFIYMHCTRVYFSVRTFLSRRGSRCGQ